MDHFLKSLLNLLQYCFCFIFWFFGREACGILAPWPGIKPTPCALEDKVLTTGLPGKAQVFNHFDLIFYVWCKIRIHFHSLHVDIQSSQHHLLKRLSFPHCIFLASCQRSVDCMYVGLLLGSVCCSIGLFVCLYVSTILFWLL